MSALPRRTDIGEREHSSIAGIAAVIAVVGMLLVFDRSHGLSSVYFAARSNNLRSVAEASRRLRKVYMAGRFSAPLHSRASELNDFRR
jgi:hypothetical protein